MKKILGILFILLAAITLIACDGFGESDTKKYTVTFNTDGGTLVPSQKVTEGRKAKRPEKDPTRENYDFVNWFENLETTDPFDFNLPINNDITIYAKWTEVEDPDYIDQEILFFDFGLAAVTGYDTSSITFTNTDGSKYTLNKARAQINKGGDVKESQEQVFVMAPIGLRTISYIEFDLLDIDNLSKLEFSVSTWNIASFNRIKGFNNATLTLEKQTEAGPVLMNSIDGETNTISKLVQNEFTNIVYQLEGSGVYRIVFEAPSANTTNTAQALVIDDISVYIKVTDFDGHLVTFDYNYEGSPLNRVVVVKENERVELFEPYREGYNFMGWYLEEEEFDLETIINSNIKLKAKWEEGLPVVTFDYGYLGLAALLVEVGLDGKVIMPAEPQREGFVFVNWMETNKRSDVHQVVDFNKVLIGNVRYIAKWDKIDQNPQDLVRDDESLEELYSSVAGMTGAPLFNELRDIVTENHLTPKNYGDARYILEKADRHPKNSKMVLTIYDRDMIKGPYDHPNWEREHVWPNSKLGVERVGNGDINQGSDLHNLRAIVPIVNNRRSNFFFNNTTKASPLGHIITTKDYYPGNEDIGDVARILLYMVLRYEVLNLTSNETILRLEEFNETPAGAYMGKLDVLYKWHLLDPVDDFEINRNEVIASAQGNRNPFIDQPELFKEVFDYLVIVDTNRTLALSEVKIIIINEYKVEIDYDNFKRNKNEYVM